MALIPTAALYARLKKAQINITEKVKKAHQDVFKTNFSQGLLNYLVKNIPRGILYGIFRATTICMGYWSL